MVETNLSGAHRGELQSTGVCVTLPYDSGVSWLSWLPWLSWLVDTHTHTVHSTITSTMHMMMAFAWFGAKQQQLNGG